MTQGKRGPARELKQHQPTDENLEAASELAIKDANDLYRKRKRAAAADSATDKLLKKAAVRAAKRRAVRLAEEDEE